MRLFLLALTVLFAALPSAAQYEVSLVADVRPGNPGSNPSGLTVHDGRLFFRARGQTGTDMTGLWAYDSVTNEASFVSNRSPHGGPYGAVHIVTYDGRLFFSSGSPEHGTELWVYDAATDETRVIDARKGPESSSPQHLTGYDGRLFFSADVDENGRELWTYDPVSDEVYPVADIWSGHYNSRPEEFLVFDQRLFFSATADGVGKELWAFDASTEEISLIADLNPGPLSSGPSELTLYEDRLFFTAYHSDIGYGLWAYDLITGDASILANFDYIKNLIVYNDILFFRAWDPDLEYVLWAYDAATEETYLVADIRYPGPGGSDYYIPDFAIYNAKLFLHGIYDHSPHNDPLIGIWMYDVTTNESSHIETPHLSDGSYYISNLQVYNNRLFFAANDNNSGHELWALSSASVANEPSIAPPPVRLHAPHPNPTRSSTTVTFDIARAGPVRVEVLDVLGQRVALLADGPVAAGEHTLRWEAGPLPSGLYLVRLSAGDTVQTQRLTLVR